jgi:uncharacterized membrane protein YjfL (UPF0719 family)
MDFVDSLVTRSQALLFAVEVLLITFAAKLVDDRRTRTFDDDRLIAEDGNLAIGIRRAGLFLGGTVAMAGVLSGGGSGLWFDLLGVLTFGVAAYGALFLARWLSHRVILGGLSDDEECAKGNVGVGVVQFGIFVATGLILNGALTGDDGDPVRGLAAFALYFLLGQVVFLALAFAFQRMTPFDDRAELRRGNRAVGVEFAGLFISIAIILRAGLIGPSNGMAADLAEFLTSAVVGGVALLAFQTVIRRAFLKGADVSRGLTQDNVAMAVTLQAITVAFALLVASVG